MSRIDSRLRLAALLLAALGFSSSASGQGLADRVAGVSSGAVQFAYAARAGIAAIVVHAAGGPASSKLAQVRVTGARLIEVGGTFDDAFAAAEEIAAREGAVVVNSTNPDRIEGQKTAALEIIEQVGTHQFVIQVLAT